MQPFDVIDGCNNWTFRDRATEVFFFRRSACLRLLIFASIFAFQKSGAFAAE
jgi:hypothetical protein